MGGVSDNVNSGSTVGAGDNLHTALLQDTVDYCSTVDVNIPGEDTVDVVRAGDRDEVQQPGDGGTSAAAAGANLGDIHGERLENIQDPIEDDGTWASCGASGWLL